MATTVIDIFEERVNASGAQVALRGTGTTAGMTWREWFDAAERLAAALIEWGLEPGVRCALVSSTRPEWVIADIAIMMAGGVCVPLYPSSPAGAYASILKDCTPEFVLAEDPLQLQKVASAAADVPSLTRGVYFDPEHVFRTKPSAGPLQLAVTDIDVGQMTLRSLEELDAAGRRVLVDSPARVGARRRALRSDSVASIVYTSGTSRDPLGVCLTHDNFLAEVEALTALGLLQPDDAQLLFLPLAHIFARVLYITAIGYGIETTFVHDLHRLREYWQTYQPTFFAGVPHIFERIQAQIEADVRKSSVRQAALDVARWVRRVDGVGRTLARVVDESVIAPVVSQGVRDLFGGRIRFLISGGAPLPVHVAEFFAQFGLLMLEGYGLTEVTAVATVNLPDEHRFGTVGRPLAGIEVAIDDDGEILVRGRSVMRGYLNKPEINAAVLEPQGWFHTGDIGEYDRDGFLRITGRKKDIIVTSGGKNIPPAPIEEALRNHPLVASAVIFADGRPFVVGLLGLRRDAVAQWGRERGLGVQEALTSNDLRALLAEHVAAVNAQLAPFEAVRRFDVLPDELSVDDELTPTNKVRRHRVFEKYRGRIDALYAQDLRN